MFLGLLQPELLKNIGFIRFLGLLKPELLENNWFYKVSGSPEARIVEKTICFIRFLGLLKAELLENHWFYKVFGGRAPAGRELIPARFQFCRTHSAPVLVYSF